MYYTLTECGLHADLTLYFCVPLVVPNFAVYGKADLVASSHALPIVELLISGM